MRYLQKVINELKNLELDRNNNIFREKFIFQLRKTIDLHKNIVLIANGGSSAIASHFSTDLIKNKNAKVNFISDHGLLTCLSNDYGYENSGVEFLKRFSDIETMVILISSSGKSLNILNSAKYCIQNKIKCFGLAGFGEKSLLFDVLETNCCLQVNSKNYNVVEILHLAVLLDAVEELMIQ